MIIKKLLDMNFDEHKKYIDLFGKSFLMNEQMISLKKEEKNVLYYLYKYGESPMGDITNSFDFAYSTTNYIIKSLESKELIAIHIPSTDNRMRLISLTAKGKALLELLLEHLEKIALNMVHQLLPIICTPLQDELSSEEKAVLEKLLAKINYINS